MNYIGPNGVEGIKGYIDGTEVVSDMTKNPRSVATGDGRIVVGRYRKDKDNIYASVQIDELSYFNAALTDDDVLSIYNSA